MEERPEVIDAMAMVKADVRRRTEDAIMAILALVWEYRENVFSFEDYPAIDIEVNIILQRLSEGNLADAERRARALLVDLGLGEYADRGIEFAEREIDGEDALWRLDMHSSHLKALLAGWIAAAAVMEWSQPQMMRDFWAHMANPMSSQGWVKAGLVAPKWGRGYASNILDGMSRIGKDVIASSFSRAEYDKAVSLGAAYFIRHRNSGYICPLCDSYCERRLPIEKIIFTTHSLCVCYNDYYTADGRRIEI